MNNLLTICVHLSILLSVGCSKDDRVLIPNTASVDNTSENINTIDEKPELEEEETEEDNKLPVTTMDHTMMLSADGTTETYSLITQNLAPGYAPIETPDCAHTEFGKHIDQTWDNELESYVFRFHIHTNSDNDRCIKFDRQRNEIKTFDKSPENLLGKENETVTYTWKMKLPSDFKSSPKFTHLHQLKSVGGNYDSMPMYTLSTRKGTPDQLELRYAALDTQITLDKTDLAPLLGTWVSITETITYGDSGDYTIAIKRHSDQKTLFEYSHQNQIHWRPNGEFVRPKWGIYRSLVYKEDLQDEILLCTDFGIEK